MKEQQQPADCYNRVIFPKYTQSENPMDFLQLFEEVCLCQAVPETLYCLNTKISSCGSRIGFNLSDLH